LTESFKHADDKLQEQENLDRMKSDSEEEEDDE